MEGGEFCVEFGGCGHIRPRFEIGLMDDGEWTCEREVEVDGIGSGRCAG